MFERSSFWEINRQERANDYTGSFCFGSSKTPQCQDDIHWFRPSGVRVAKSSNETKS